MLTPAALSIRRRLVVVVMWIDSVTLLVTVPLPCDSRPRASREPLAVASLDSDTLMSRLGDSPGFHSGNPRTVAIAKTAHVLSLGVEQESDGALQGGDWRRAFKSTNRDLKSKSSPAHFGSKSPFAPQK